MRSTLRPQINYRELSEEIATQLHTLKFKYEYLLRLSQKRHDDKKANALVSL